MLCVACAECLVFYCYAECRYVDCHYAECRGAIKWDCILHMGRLVALPKTIDQLEKTC